MVVVFLGPPGSGKGTQAERLRDEYGFTHFDTGAALRAEAASGSDFGRRIAAIIEGGNLVPLEVIRELVVRFLAGCDSDRVLFDGFPRNLDQAEVLEAGLAGIGDDLDHAIFLQLSQDALLGRIVNRRICASCGAIYSLVTSPPPGGMCPLDGGELLQRKDDTPEVFTNRLRVYMEQTVPVLDLYRNRGLLREVDGARTVENVTQSILRVVGIDGVGDGA